MTFLFEKFREIGLQWIKSSRNFDNKCKVDDDNVFELWIWSPWPIIYLALIAEFNRPSRWINHRARNCEIDSGDTGPLISISCRLVGHVGRLGPREVVLRLTAQMDQAANLNWPLANHDPAHRLYLGPQVCRLTCPLRSREKVSGDFFTTFDPSNHRMIYGTWEFILIW